MKVFITVELEKDDVTEDEETHETIINDPLSEILDVTFDMVKEGVPFQTKITTLPPRYKGFRKASELIEDA
jgi:hypothetical protein